MIFENFVQAKDHRRRPIFNKISWRMATFEDFLDQVDFFMDFTGEFRVLTDTTYTFSCVTSPRQKTSGDRKLHPITGQIPVRRRVHNRPTRAVNKKVAKNSVGLSYQFSLFLLKVDRVCVVFPFIFWGRF